ncbi:AcrR family transcriptional regulator [Geomicrobium halophilum]|uniref:AcrR family transcriptional regulator n=1 Tax=Geomicrobium halophilum TaxID=549000 RepID=A0A841PZY5_9BACL|nr:TetR/AcrR family transcriptional regulator [Geomicrobium halophilum]MBB6450723.1 AcrR family transcriptional regulator [Geomicrobium halophilum]
MKENILKTALQRFAKDGYFSTSMQHIAETCGISKASLYKYFSSKEELLLEALEYNLEQMVERTTSVNLNQTLSPKEQLKEKIILELEATKENRTFINLLIRSVPSTKNAEMMRVLKRSKLALMNWHRDSLIHAYGEEVKPFLWDLVVLFQGTLREYVVLMSDEHKSFPADAVAALIISHLDTIILSKPHLPPVLTSDLMQDYETFNPNGKNGAVQEEIEDVRYRIREKVMTEANAEQRDEIEGAIEALYQEIDAISPRRYMIDSLGLYLGQMASINDELKTLNALLSTRRNH